MNKTNTNCEAEDVKIRVLRHSSDITPTTFRLPSLSTVQSFRALGKNAPAENGLNTGNCCNIAQVNTQPQLFMPHLFSNLSQFARSAKISEKPKSEHVTGEAQSIGCEQQSPGKSSEERPSCGTSFLHQGESFKSTISAII